MASDTNIKKTKNAEAKPRWFRLAPARRDLPEVNHLMDLYWGGPERRITSMTLRIMGVNAIALITLMFGILYLSQYQNNLINARLETFQTELKLIASTVAEDSADKNLIASDNLIARLSATAQQRIRVFDKDGNLVADTRKMPGLDDRAWSEAAREKDEFHSVETLRNMARFVLELLPDRRKLPTYPEATDQNLQIYPDLPEALNRNISLSVWQNEEERIFLSAAAPVIHNNTLKGAVLLTREGTEIENDISSVWREVLKIFLGTLILTTMLSIYLSGVIARPLKKLARAAEKVRTGKATADDIPDMSDRKDEIGELSVVLRQMTRALWEKMDSIERFAADVSHELKNPLTSLKSAVETAAIVKKKSDRDKLMDIIQHDTQRLDRLITDISNASRIDTELSREAFKDVDLKTMLHNVLDAYNADPLARKNGTDGWHKAVRAENATVTLDANLNKDIKIWGLESRLVQVFQNILSNALSFTPKGGTISVFVKTKGNAVHIHIEDEGPGIPEGKLENIFERFYSERPEAEAYGHHSGLGLSICKQIIAAHGGDMYAENIKSGGARFTVILDSYE